MTDIFACSKQLNCHICNCHAVMNGVESNHSAVRLDLALTSFKCTPPTALDCVTTDWHKITTDKATNHHYNDLLIATTNDDEINMKTSMKPLQKWEQRRS
jgi:hypothetical protein